MANDFANLVHSPFSDRALFQNCHKPQQHSTSYLLESTEQNLAAEETKREVSIDL